MRPEAVGSEARLEVEIARSVFRCELTDTYSPAEADPVVGRLRLIAE